MFKPLLRSLVVAFACAVTAFAAVNPLDREIILAPHTSAQPEDREITRWQQTIAADGDDRADASPFERLGWAYVAKARRTQDAGFYKLAEKTVDVMEARFGMTVEVRLLRGHVSHNLHRFRAAEAIARELVAERGAPAELALLSDALMEQGKLDACVAVLQQLVNAKPGVEAFSRIAHVRWLKGDIGGAIASMEAAVRSAGVREREVRAWLLTRLSAYRLQIGDPATALALADGANSLVDEYAAGEFARGRALWALDRRHDAVTALRVAVSLNPLPEYQWWLADALVATSQTNEATQVIAALKSRGALTDPRMYSVYLATRAEDVALALRLARGELDAREDVFTHDAIAWALAAGGDFAGADSAIRPALAVGTKDPRLALHAGEIARARGDTFAAEQFIAEARAGMALLTPSERARLEARGVASVTAAAR